MSKYPEELKKQVVEDYIRGDRQTSEILGMYNIPKSNLFRWLKIERLETIVSILKRVGCTVDAPLSDRLMELERLYGEYHVHTLCDALEVSRGTFYNHIKRNKRENTIYAQRHSQTRKTAPYKGKMSNLARWGFRFDIVFQERRRWDSNMGPK